MISTEFYCSSCQITTIRLVSPTELNRTTDCSQCSGPASYRMSDPRRSPSLPSTTRKPQEYWMRRMGRRGERRGETQ